MQLKDLLSDLEALRELYGLVQCGGDAASNELGELSKLLLKNLLDGAVKRVLETQKKIIAAAERGVCGTSSFSESEKGRALSELQPYVSPNMLKGGLDVIHNLMKESNHHAFSLLKDEDSPNKLTTHEVISQQSRLSFSLDKPENRKKRCELNEQSSMKQESDARILGKDYKQQGQLRDPLEHFYQASGDEWKLLEGNENAMKVVKSNEKMRHSSTCGLQGTLSVVGSVVGSSNSLASGDNQDEKEGEAVNNLSEDVDSVVKHIESHISALRPCSKLTDATKGAVPHRLGNVPTSMCPIVQAKQHLVKKSALSHAVEPFSDRNELLLSGLDSQRIVKKDDSNGSHQVLGHSENDLFDDILAKGDGFSTRR